MAVNSTLTLAADLTSSTNQTPPCDLLAHGASALLVFPVFYSLVFLVSGFGNSLVLYVTCRDKRRQKFNSTSVYLVNLALSDALFTLALPGRVVYYLRRFDWPFGDPLCRLTAVLFFTNTYTGIAFMTCISLDRYLTMVHPHRLRGLRGAKVVRAVCCLVWFLTCLQTAPLLFRPMLLVHQGRRTCMEYFAFESSPSTPYLLFLACVVSFCSPLLVIVACYARINLKLRANARRSPLAARTGRSRRANTVILLILLTFVVCFSPYHVNVMRFMARKMAGQPSCDELRAFKVALQVTVSLMNLNCCLDPVIYFFAIKTYKQRVLRLFKGYLSASGPSSKNTADNSSSNT